MKITDWGTPDWRVAESYPQPDELLDLGNPRTRAFWKWEFLRRHDGYRDIWVTRAPIRYKRVLEFAKYQISQGHSDWPTPVLDENFRVWANKEETRLYGVSFIACPVLRIPPRGIFLLGGGSSIVWKDHDVDEEDRKDGYFMIEFDVSLPVEQQIENAKNTLIELQNDYLGKINHKRMRPDKWSKYLRVLDARKSGASWMTIGTEILGSAEDAAKDIARSVHKQALGVSV